MVWVLACREAERRELDTSLTEQRLKAARGGGEGQLGARCLAFQRDERFLVAGHPLPAKPRFSKQDMEHLQQSMEVSKAVFVNSGFDGPTAFFREGVHGLHKKLGKGLLWGTPKKSLDYGRNPRSANLKALRQKQGHPEWPSF